MDIIGIETMNSVYASMMLMETLWTAVMCSLVIIASILSVYLLPWSDKEVLRVHHQAVGIVQIIFLKLTKIPMLMSRNHCQHRLDS